MACSMTDLSQFADFFEAVLAAVPWDAKDWDDRIDEAAEALAQQPPWKERLAAAALSGPEAWWAFEYQLGRDDLRGGDLDGNSDQTR